MGYDPIPRVDMSSIEPGSVSLCDIVVPEGAEVARVEPGIIKHINLEPKKIEDGDYPINISP